MSKWNEKEKEKNQEQRRKKFMMLTQAQREAWDRETQEIARHNAKLKERK